MIRLPQTHKERGDIGVIVVIILLLLIASGVGYWLWSRHQNTTTSTTGTSSSSSPSDLSMIHTCTSLSLSQGSSNGTAGTIYKDAVLTNTGTSTCILTGYPGVFMTDSHSMQVGSGAEANSLYAVSTVTLAPGGKAHTVVAYPEQGNFPAGTCSSIGSNMKLYAPGLATALTAPWSDYSCPGFSTTALQPGS